MSYASSARIAMLIPRQDLDALLDDEALGASNEQIAVRESAILAGVDEVIDAQLQGLYPVPFTGTVPPLVGQIADRLAAVAIYSRRPGELPPTVKALAEWAEDRMRRIIRREIQLLPAGEPAKAQPPLTSKSDDDRIFSTDKLGQMPS